jgi:ribosomal protein S18 acetylase RimI-like enzyme
MQVETATADEWSLWRELRLQALQDAPDAFGSTLADWQGEGDQEQRWRARLESVDYNAISTVHGRGAGMASGLLVNERVELISMWVAHFARGQRVGDALVDSVIRWADEMKRDVVELSVREGNDHAIALYVRHGFHVVGLIDRDDNSGPLERLMAFESGHSRSKMGIIPYKQSSIECSI